MRRPSPPSAAWNWWMPGRSVPWRLRPFLISSDPTMKKLLLGFCLLLGVRVTVHAALTPPDQLVRTVTDEVLEIVRQDEGIRRGDANRVIALVEEKVLPHFNFRRMTMLAVGRDWRQATPE